MSVGSVCCCEVEGEECRRVGSGGESCFRVVMIAWECFALKYGVIAAIQVDRIEIGVIAGEYK